MGYCVTRVAINLEKGLKGVDMSDISSHEKQILLIMFGKNSDLGHFVLFSLIIVCKKLYGVISRILCLF